MITWEDERKNREYWEKYVESKQEFTIFELNGLLSCYDELHDLSAHYDKPVTIPLGKLISIISAIREADETVIMAMDNQDEINELLGDAHDALLKADPALDPDIAYFDYE